MKGKEMFWAILAVGLALAVGWGGTAQATLLAYEGFDYETGPLPTGQSRGFGWLTPWEVLSLSTPLSVKVERASLSYSGGSVSVSGGDTALEIKANGDWTGWSEVIRRKVSNTGIGEPVYMSLLLKWVDSSTQTNAEFTAALFDNSDNGDDYSAGFGITDPQPWNNNEGGFFARVGGFGQSPGQASGGTPKSDTTYFLVAKLWEDSSTQKLTLWVNPTTLDENAPGAAWTLTASKSLFDVEFTDFGSKFARFEKNDTVYIDEIRIGETFKDVVVPEPTSVIALGGLALVAGAAQLRRLRRKGEAVRAG
ncbi:MAG: PEP-CTERM sorting domain-containing protein [Thermogutta sp.]